VIGVSKPRDAMLDFANALQFLVFPPWTIGQSCREQGNPPALCIAKRLNINGECDA
jgi:hypothetical protein